MSGHTPARVIRATPEGCFIRASELPGTATAARKAASRAVADGHLLPVRRGLYYRGRRTRYGMTGPRIEEVANAVLGTDGTGPAGYSAARAWGVTTQVPPVLHMATLRPTEPIDGVKLYTRRNFARIGLNAKEIALLELLRAPEVFVEADWNVFEAKVREAVKVGEVRSRLLADAVDGEHNRAVRTNFDRLASAQALTE